MRRLLMATMVLGAMAATRAEAGMIVGTQVKGSISFGGDTTNYFDPANGFVPAGSGYENTAGTTVPISASAVEFGFQDNVNRDTADFTEGQLTFTDAVLVNNGNNAVQLTFTDSAFTGATLSSTNFAGLTYTFSGTTLTINIAASNPATGATFTAAFNIASAGAVPEPASALMLGMGVVGVGLAGWKRRRVCRCRD